jgi:hypothetical protein
MATYTFTLHSGVTLADAQFGYQGAQYDVVTQLAAGSGSIVTTDDTLAAQLRALRTPDGNLLLDEAGVGTTTPTVKRAAVGAYVQPDQPDQGTGLWLKVDDATGAVSSVKSNDGTHGWRETGIGGREIQRSQTTTRLASLTSTSYAQIGSLGLSAISEPTVPVEVEFFCPLVQVGSASDDRDGRDPDVGRRDDSTARPRGSRASRSARCRCA